VETDALLADLDKAEQILEPAVLEQAQAGQGDVVVGVLAGADLGGLVAQADLLQVLEGGGLP